MKTIIFVCGSARSGSTLADLVLGNDPAGFSLGEVSSWFRPWRSHHFDIKCGCGVYPCPTWEQIKSVDESHLYDRVFEVTGADFVVDSSKRLTWVIDQTNRLRAEGRYDVRHVFLYKDPVALAYSHWKRGRSDLDYVAREFLYYGHARDARLPMVAVSLDWLIEDPEARLPVVCDRLGIPSRPGKIRFWEKTHHHLFGSFGPRKQLFETDPSIYHEQFAPEFVTQIPDIEAKMRADARLAPVFDLLKAHDVTKSPERPSSRPLSLRKPMFYYRDRIREIRMRYRPEHYLDREASTIQQWNV